MEATFVVVGGGIAGVTCAETLAFLEPEESIILLSVSSLVKTAINIRAVTKTLVTFDVEEKDSSSLTTSYPNIKVVHDSLEELDDTVNCIITSSGLAIKYKFLCLCMGARPKLIPQAKGNPFVLGIRDTDSVESFLSKLKKSRKIIIVGNGGIASELAYKIKNAEVVWVIKDKHITATFVDPGAAEFFQPSLKFAKNEEETPTKRMRYTQDSSSKSGAALGPDWYSKLEVCGAAALPKSVTVVYEAEVKDIIVKGGL